MATNPLPPFPTNSPPGSFQWVDWFKKLENFIVDITDVSGSGAIDPGAGIPIIAGGVEVGQATGYYTRVANFVMFTLELHLGVDAGGTGINDVLVFDLPTATFPISTYDDTVTWTNEVEPPVGYAPHQDGVGSIVGRRVSLGPVSVAPGEISNFIISGRYFY